MTTTSSPSPPPQLGPLVRLWGLQKDQLPPETATAEELRPFLEAIVSEALPFIDSAAPKKKDTKKDDSMNKPLWRFKNTKTHRDSRASVETLERTVSAQQLAGVLVSPPGPDDGAGGESRKPQRQRGRQRGQRGETWICRRSVHEDAAEPGTASWAEFDRFHRREHAKSEDELTPNVVAAHEAARWDASGDAVVTEVELDDGDGPATTTTTTTWGDFTLALQEMRHKVGRPVLTDRTFPVLQMTCAAVARRKSSGNGSNNGEEQEQEAQPCEFLVVSIPVADFAGDERSKLAKKRDTQVAVYVSIERIRKMDDGQIEWVMATASDAGGALPMWMQTAALPGLVWKDVPLFFSWVATGRDASAGGDQVVVAKAKG